ncbi:MAG TPA: alpha/beta hydrolase, partial [Myxococcaceae bacterium]
RAGFEELLVAIGRDLPEAEGLTIEDRLVPGWEGDPAVPVRVYRPRVPSDGTLLPAILQVHGGGFIVGNVEAEHAGSVLLAAGIGAVVVSVEYRLAPEHPYPAALRDCYAALASLHAEAQALGVDAARVALMGASAGGGLAAATALLARDLGGPPVCFQLLQIPELDDRLDTPSMLAFEDSPVWNRPLAVQSWRAYLGPLSGAEDIPAHAAPARADDLSGLPPAYISTAENDPLRDEGITYALRLLQAGVSVELHQFPGTFHGSALVTSAAVSRRAQGEVAAVLRRALGIDE